MDKVLKQAETDIKNLLSIYESWSSKMQPGKVHYVTYDDLTEFVNARMETVDSCQTLLSVGKVSDTLALCRSLLENYLLFILICRGTKYFKLISFKGKSEKEIESHLKEERKRIGRGSLIAIEKHPTIKKHYLYIFEGIKSSDQPDYAIPYHYFGFKDFDPETMRLDEDDYFTYYAQSETIKTKRKQHRKEQDFLYHHYLSYDAVLNCLRINEIADDAAIKRINAHYTFLGKFLHPTNDTFRDLRERSNYHTGKTIVGFEHPYKNDALLLAYVYVIHLTLGLLQEMADVLDKAPKDYIVSSGASEVRNLVKELLDRYNYFWFIFNEAPDYDKFQYCFHHLDQNQYKAIGNDYRKVDPSIVTFDKHIYSRFSRSLSGWRNDNRGIVYTPPF